jgi:hypothetical protein
MSAKSTVYVMEAAAGLVKVGHSQEIQKRRLHARWKKGVQSLDIVFTTEPTVMARLVEKMAICRLREMTGVKRGEWFTVSKEIAIGVVEDAMAASHEVPPEDAPPIKPLLVPVRVSLFDHQLAAIDKIKSERMGMSDRASIIRELVAQALADRKHRGKR